jgi:hypothetical protein
MTISEEQGLEIRIEFERNAGDPTRIFYSMAGLIESVQAIDSHLGACLGATVRTSLVLEDIETASLKSRLRTVIEAIPDEPLKHGDIKKLIGHYLLKGKHKILDWCNGREEIATREEVKQLEHELHVLAEETNIKQIPAYTQINTATLLSDIAEIKAALNYLGAKDHATMSSSEGFSNYNKRLEVSDQIVREIVTRETLASTSERIIKVKKPDYLGQSRWVFKYSGHMIEAKISDRDWLNKFQSQSERLQPGDSLKALLREEVSYGYDSEIVQTDYEVVKVIGVIPGLSGLQGELV